MDIRYKLATKIFGDTTLESILKNSYTGIIADGELIRKTIDIFLKAVEDPNLKITFNSKVTSFSMIIEGVKRLETSHGNMVKLIDAINKLFADSDGGSSFTSPPDIIPTDESTVAINLREKYAK